MLHLENSGPESDGLSEDQALGLHGHIDGKGKHAGTENKGKTKNKGKGDRKGKQPVLQEGLAARGISHQVREGEFTPP